MSDFAEITEAFHQARTAPDVTDRASGLEEADRIGGVAMVLSRMTGESRPDCLDCGEDIDPRRLHAVKNAVRCISCQDDHDKREARRHG